VSVKGSEWKEKAENLELELQQCYKAQSRLSEHLVVEVAESADRVDSNKVICDSCFSQLDTSPKKKAK